MGQIVHSLRKRLVQIEELVHKETGKITVVNLVVSSHRVFLEARTTGERPLGYEMTMTRVTEPELFFDYFTEKTIHLFNNYADNEAP